MKIILYAGGVLSSVLLSITPAFADPQPAAGQGQASGYEAGFQDGMRAAMAHHGWSHEGGHKDMMEHMSHMAMMSGKDEDKENEGGGARFKFVHGDSKFDVKCSSEEPMTDCVKAAILLFEHVATEKNEMEQPKGPPPPHGGPGSPPPHGPGGPPPPQPGLEFR